MVLRSFLRQLVFTRLRLKSIIFGRDDTSSFRIEARLRHFYDRPQLTMCILNYCAHDGKVSLRFLYKRLAYVDEDVDRGIVTRLRYRVTITSKGKEGNKRGKSLVS